MRDRILAVSISLFLIGLSVSTLFFIIRPAYLPYVPITRVDTARANIEHPYLFNFTESIRFVGYNAPESTLVAGRPIPITLHWEVIEEIDRDYLFEVCLNTRTGSKVTCQVHHPSDGRYPTSAWETGYLVQDALFLMPPACLSGGTYSLSLSILPLRSDIAQTTIDGRVTETMSLSLGTLKLASANSQAGDHVQVCADGRCNQASLKVNHIRQNVSVVAIHDAPPPSTISPVLMPLGVVQSITPWLSIPQVTEYVCTNGQWATTHNFILDAAVAPLDYNVIINGQPIADLTLAVNSRARTFDIPQTIEQNAAYNFGDEIKFLGYDIDKTSYPPGDTMEIVTYWQAIQQMRNDYFASLHLLDYRVEMWSQDDNRLGDAYMNIFWSPGEVVTDVHHIKVQSHIPPGLYQVELGLYDYENGNFEFLPVAAESDETLSNPLNIILAEVRIQDTAFGQTPDYDIGANLAGHIDLLGYNLSPDAISVSGSLALTLFWENQQRILDNYTVFTQLIGPDGRVWAQQDNQPQQGRYPTSQWQTSDQVVDRYYLEIDPNAPPGNYQLITGMYDLNTGQRLMATTQQGQPYPNDAILLGNFSVN